MIKNNKLVINVDTKIKIHLSKSLIFLCNFWFIFEKIS